MNILQHNHRKEQQYLLLWTLFCICLLICRMVYTHTLDFRFMAFNLFLAWIPYWVAIFAQKLGKRKFKFLLPIAIFIWFIFLPNAPYMITDIFHLHKYQNMPMWYDLILLLSFAWTGLLLGFLSLKKVLHVFNKYPVMRKPSSVFILFLICGTGIYLGRYERWNSWEIITQPNILVSDMLNLLQNPYEVIQMASLSTIFAIFFTLIYMAFVSPVESQEQKPE